MTAIYLLTLLLVAGRAYRERALAPAVDPYPWLDVALWASLVSTAVLAWLAPPPIAVVLALLACAVLAVPTLVSAAGQRAGWVRFSYLIGRLQSTRDAHGHGVLSAARAALQAEGSSPARGWLDGELAGIKPCRGHDLVARALLAQPAAPRMRALLEHLLEATTSVDLAVGVRAAAVEWLLLEAAERGDWRSVVVLGETHPERSGRARLALALGRQLVDGKPHGRRALASVRLWSLWLLAGAPAGAREVIAAATAGSAAAGAGAQQHRQETSADDVGVATPSRAGGGDEDAWADASSLHLRLAERRRCTAAELSALAGLWQTALDQGQAHLAARAAELGVRDHARWLGEFRSDLLAQLLMLSEGQTTAFAADPPPLLGEALALRRDRELHTLELAAEALARRVGGKRVLAPLAEFEEFLHLVALHRDLARRGGPALRRLAFPAMNEAFSALAIWWWNDRDQRFLAREVFRWLHAEAQAVGDAQALETHGHNRSLSVY